MQRILTEKNLLNRKHSIITTSDIKCYELMNGGLDRFLQHSLEGPINCELIRPIRDNFYISNKRAPFDIFNIIIQT